MSMVTVVESTGNNLELLTLQENEVSRSALLSGETLNGKPIGFKVNFSFLCESLLGFCL